MVDVKKTLPVKNKNNYYNCLINNNYLLIYHSYLS